MLEAYFDTFASRVNIRTSPALKLPCMQMLIDPVCLMTCCPQLLHSFIYKVPTWNSKLLTTPTGFMDLLRFIFSRDLMVAEVGLSLLHALLSHLVIQRVSKPSLPSH